MENGAVPIGIGVSGDTTRMACENKSLFRSLFRRFTTGVAVVGIQDKDEPRGVTVNSLTAVSLDPMLLLFCIARQSRSAALLQEAGNFSINLLTSEQTAVSKHYAGGSCPDQDWQWSETSGVPALDDSNASFVCKLDRFVEAGDHYIVIGQVVELLGPDKAHTPLLYHGGRYAQLAYPEDGNPAAADDPSDFWWTG